MSTAYCVGRARREPSKRTATDCTGAAQIPLTSSSDSLCGTEKQLVTSTECLSTVPVRENCPVLCDPRAPKTLRPLSLCFQILSHLVQDHHLNPMITQKPTCEPSVPMPAFTTNFYSTSDHFIPTAHLFLDLTKTGSPLTSVFSYSHPRPPSPSGTTMLLIPVSI